MLSRRQAWKDAREPYLLSEPYRFYDGPIDTPEPEINSWPLDEAFIDFFARRFPDAGAMVGRLPAGCVRLAAAHRHTAALGPMFGAVSVERA